MEGTFYLNELDKKGFTVIEDVLSKSKLVEIMDAFDKSVTNKNISFCNTRFEGKKTIRLYNPLNSSITFSSLILNDKVLSIAENILGTDLLLSSMTIISLHPGEIAQPIHSDDGPIPIPRPHIPIVINAMYALTDFTKSNGATMVVPGSHKFDGLPNESDKNKLIPIEMQAGSVLIFNGSLWHAGGANNTASPRVGATVYYSSGFLRPEENYQLGIDASTMKSLPRRLQELCGYSTYKGLYGHIDRKDPITLLGKASDKKMVWDWEDPKVIHHQ